MADTTTILNWGILSDFIIPFLLIFFITFAILERTKLFGDKKKQINALIAFVIGLIFVGAVYPKLVVSNLILFLTVTIVAVFVILLIWGFIFGDEKGFKLNDWMKWILGITVTIAFVWAVMWATGWSDQLGNLFTSGNGLGQTIITNGVFLLVIAAALALILYEKKTH
jgi:hypothetical protein